MRQHKFFKRLKGTFGFYDLSLKHIVLIQDLWLTLFLQLIYYRQRICIFREQKLQNIPSILARWSVDHSWLSLLPNRRLYFHSIWLSSLTLLTLYLLYLKVLLLFTRSVVSDSLRPHEPQHARPPCPSQTPEVYSNSCPLSWWCHPTISSSVTPFSSCPQSLPASGSFPMSQLFPSGGQSIGVSASISVLPVNTQDWSPLGWTGWISL